jgi:rubrerythrin
MERLIDLSEREILALAIFSEEEDSKIYRGFAEGLREQYPASAKVFDEMADEEVRHRTMLFELYRSSNGRGFITRPRSRRGILQSGSYWTGLRTRKTNTRALPTSSAKPS